MDVGNWVRGLALVFQSGRVRAARARRFNTAVKSCGVANVDVLEDRLLLTADFGDAPDTTAATGVNNYQTLAANGGPSHVIDTTQNTLYLGGGVDGEAGTQQSLAANLDNLFTTGGRNDEDGVMSSLDLTATVGASPKITLSATNTTGAAATLYGWIDYNHNGVFENATERAQIAVPTGTTAGRFTLQFPKIVGDVAGGTYARFRLSSDAAAANSTGAATGGEVEDYKFQIMYPVKLPVAATASPKISAGVHGGPEFVDGDFAGYLSSKPIGDLDGNGVDEIVMGALSNPEFPMDNGALYVLFRNADGSVSSSVRISDQVNGGPSLDLTERFDGSISPLGDIDGDSIVDIAAGFSDQYDNGSVYIMLLNAAGTVKDYHKISSADVGISPFSVGDSFSSVESLGDIDGDGITDIAVGASGTDYFDDAFEIQTDRGAVYIVRLNADGTVKASTKIDGNGAWNPLSADFDGFGTDITALGDIDGNGMIDLAVMSDIVASEFPFLSAANILLLNSDGTVKQATRLVPNTGGDPAIANIDVMTSITAIGDIDGDGINDLAVSGQETGELSATTGEPLTNGNVINLLSLNADGTVKHSTVVAGTDAGETTDFNNFTSVSYLGDANGDGQRDLAVGIPFYFDGQKLNSSLSVLSLPSKIQNTATPPVPVLNAVVSTAGQIPTISWQADVHADRYEIWLRNQTTGQTVLNSVSVSSNSYTSPTAMGVGKFMVWIRAVNEVGKSAWSKASTFVSNSPVSIIPTPDGMSRRPELQWNSLPGAARYEIWLNDVRTPTVATMQATTKNAATTFRPATNLQAATYRLWVRGVAADGMKGQWSIMDEFTVVPSPADFGDAPDTTTGTATNNYQTLAVNGGPSHVIDATQNTLYLGGGVDGEAGDKQSLAANLDNLFTTGGRNDEDGVMSSLDLTATVGSSPKITLSATNTTGTAATLYGWIDYNHNGVFENATERAQISIPTGTTAGRFTLQFPKIAGDVAGGTYARFRLSSDAAAANSTGAATGGEVEDYQFKIMNRVKTPVNISESVRVADGVNGGPTFLADDGYGYIGLVPIGDLDGNGVGDIVIGTSGLPELATNRGAVYVLLRNADGSVSSSKRISSEVNGGPATPDGEHLGAGATSLGDIDGDGVTDIAVSSIDGEENGFVYILNLKPDGTVKSHKKLSSGVDGFPELAAGDGAAVLASLGDIDGDGISDIAVGAPGSDGAGIDRGAVYILRMNADGTVKSSNKIDGSGAWNPASADGDSLGEDITVLGDIDGNGVTDLAVMSEIVNNEHSTTTVINILQLNVDGTVKHATRLVSDEGGDASIANLNILMGLTAIGDIDGDGINDLAASGQELPERDPADPFANLFDSTNVINLLSLNSDGSVKRSITIPGPDTVGNNVFTNFTVLTKLDDVNGDLNLAVGIPFYDVQFTQEELGSVKSTLTVLTLAPKIENTLAPPVPVINAITVTPGQNPAISWAADRYADSYEVWLRNQTTGAVVLNSVPTTSNTYTPSVNLGVGNYAVWVRAVNEIGKSSWSSSSTFVSKSPVTVIATPDGMSRLPELKWNSLPGAAKYEIRLSDTRTPSVATIQTTTRNSATSFTPPTNLQAGTYRLWVRGMTADGVKGQWSTVDEFSVVPSTTITRISEPLINRPRFDFTAIPGVAKYDIWISARRSPSTAALHTTTLNASPFYQTTSVLAPGDYVVWVRGVNSDGSFGEWSARSSFTTGAPPQFEALPASELPLDSSVTLKWTPVVGAYRYEVSVERNGEYTLFKTPTTPRITVYGRTQFPQSVTRFKVRAIGSGGAAGSWSSPIEITFQDKVTSVNGVFSAEDTGHPKFTWQRPSGSYTYEVRILDVLNASAEVVHVSNISATEFIPADSLPLGKYEFQVRPVTAAGAVGVWSNPVVYVSNRIPQLKPVVVGVDPKATLEWEPLDGATSYDLQLFRVIPFNPANGGGGYTLRVETKQSIMTTSLVSPVLVDGLYEWRVREHNSQIWSLTGTFEVARTPIVNHPFFYSTQVEKLLTWSPVTGVDHYEVWINTYRGSLVLPRQNVSTNSFDLASLLPSGKYSFWVRGLGSSGHIGPWSVEESFDIF